MKNRNIKKILLFLVFIFVVFNFSIIIGDGFVYAGFGKAVVWGINMVLYGFFMVIGKFLSLGGYIFDWAIDVGNITSVIHQPAIYDAWTVVRDFFNLLFILILIFSAFSTIFQVEKYHLRKIIIILVVMALLVNFSFPIARFIIDASNMLMYFLLKQAFPSVASSTASLSSSVAGFSGIQNIIAPNEIKGDGTQTVKIIMGMIFMFILMVTMMVIGFVLLIRIIILGLLLIFSPIGFVGMIFPKFHEFAEKWWSNLFKYAFIGPIMVFMMIVAINLMSAMYNGADKASRAEMMKDGVSYESGESTAMGNWAYFFLPILVLWGGILSAQSLNNSVVSAGVGFATSKAKGVRGSLWRGGRMAVGGVAAMTGITGGMKAATNEFKKSGKIFGGKMPLYGGSDARKIKEAQVAGLVTGGVGGFKTARANAQVEQEREGISKLRKKWKDGGVNDAMLDAAEKSDDTVQNKAAAMERAENSGFKNYAQFEAASDAVNKDPILKEIFNKKAKEKRIDLVIEKKIKDGGPMLSAAAKNDIKNKEIGSLNIEGWQKQQGIKEIVKDTEMKTAAQYALSKFGDNGLDRMKDKMNSKNIEEGEKGGLW